MRNFCCLSWTFLSTRGEMWKENWWTYDSRKSLDLIFFLRRTIKRYLKYLFCDISLWGSLSWRFPILHDNNWLQACNLMVSGSIPSSKAKSHHRYPKHWIQNKWHSLTSCEDVNSSYLPVAVHCRPLPVRGAAISPISPLFCFSFSFFSRVKPCHAARCPWTIELVNNQDERIIESKSFRRTGDIRFMIDLGGRDWWRRRDGGQEGSGRNKRALSFFFTYFYIPASSLLLRLIFWSVITLRAPCGTLHWFVVLLRLFNTLVFN